MLRSDVFKKIPTSNNFAFLMMINYTPPTPTKKTPPKFIPFMLVDKKITGD